MESSRSARCCRSLRRRIIAIAWVSSMQGVARPARTVMTRLACGGSRSCFSLGGCYPSTRGLAETLDAFLTKPQGPGTVRARHVPKTPDASPFRAFRDEEVLRAMLFCSTSARQRIRHGLRHTAARAGRRPRRSVPNDRLPTQADRLRPRLEGGRLPVAGSSPASAARSSIWSTSRSTCGPRRGPTGAHRPRHADRHQREVRRTT